MEIIEQFNKALSFDIIKKVKIIGNSLIINDTLKIHSAFIAPEELNWMLYYYYNDKMSECRLIDIISYYSKYGFLPCISFKQFNTLLKNTLKTTDIKKDKFNDIISFITDQSIINEEELFLGDAEITEIAEITEKDEINLRKMAFELNKELLSTIPYIDRYELYFKSDKYFKFDTKIWNM